MFKFHNISYRFTIKINYHNGRSSLVAQPHVLLLDWQTFNVELRRRDRKFYCNISFSNTTHLWNYLPIPCFPATYSHLKYKCNVFCLPETSSFDLLSPR